MIKARATSPDGRQMYLFGLSAENVSHLIDGEIIQFDALDMGIDGIITICYGLTELELQQKVMKEGIPIYVNRKG